MTTMLTRHEIALEAQPIADQWMATCECGWRNTISIHEAGDSHFAGQLAAALHIKTLPAGSFVLGPRRR